MGLCSPVYNVLGIALTSAVIAQMRGLCLCNLFAELEEKEVV